MSSDRGHARQVIGSLLVAAAIVAIAIVVVTAKFGPTSTAELEAREEAREQRIEAIEERREAREEAREERAEGG
jgi:hypothetical protein